MTAHFTICQLANQIPNYKCNKDKVETAIKR